MPQKEKQLRQRQRGIDLNRLEVIEEIHARITAQEELEEVTAKKIEEGELSQDVMLANVLPYTTDIRVAVNLLYTNQEKISNDIVIPQTYESSPYDIGDRMAMRELLNRLIEQTQDTIRVMTSDIDKSIYNRDGNVRKNLLFWLDEDPKRELLFLLDETCDFYNSEFVSYANRKIGLNNNSFVNNKIREDILEQIKVKYLSKKLKNSCNCNLYIASFDNSAIKAKDLNKDIVFANFNDPTITKGFIKNFDKVFGSKVLSSNESSKRIIINEDDKIQYIINTKEFIETRQPKIGPDSRSISPNEPLAPALV